jgi:hypothetical protein
MSNHDHIERQKLYYSSQDFLVKLETAKRRLPRIAEYIGNVERQLEHLNTFLNLTCKHCEKPVEFGFNTCAGCADERGP